MNRLEKKIRARLEWYDVKMLRAILVFTDTQSWRLSTGSDEMNSEPEDDVDNLAEIRDAVEYITSHFRDPLEAKGVNLASIQDEVEEIVPYARKYLSIDQEGYQKVWFKLHVSPDAESKWPNIFDFVSWCLAYLSQMLMWRDCSLP